MLVAISVLAPLDFGTNLSLLNQQHIVSALMRFLKKLDAPNMSVVNVSTWPGGCAPFCAPPNRQKQSLLIYEGDLP